MCYSDWCDFFSLFSPSSKHSRGRLLPFFTVPLGVTEKGEIAIMPALSSKARPQHLMIFCDPVRVIIRSPHGLLFFFIPRALLCILLLVSSSVQTTKCAWERGSASVLVSWYYHEAKAKSTLKTRAKKEGAASLTHAWRGRKKWHVCSEHATDNMAAELCTPEKPCLVLSLEENGTSQEILTVNYDVKQSQFAKLTPELLR